RCSCPTKSSSKGGRMRAASGSSSSGTLARPRGSSPVSNSLSTSLCSQYLRMDYVVLAAWCFVVALAGGLVGLVLGNLRLPLRCSRSIASMRLLLEVPSVSSNGAEAVKLRLGGMALRNGLLVHGPNHWAAAVRTSEGAIKVASGPKPRLRGRAYDLPWVRGIARLGEAFALIPLVKRRLPEVQLPFEDGRVAF